MPYAAEGQISQAPIEGGIEITDAQYAEGLAGMIAGQLVAIEGGFAVIDPPEPEKPKDPDPMPLDIQMRQQRDSLLHQLDYVVMNPLRWAEIDESGRAELSNYRLDLLDIPQQSGFPDQIDWPIKPTILGE